MKFNWVLIPATAMLLSLPAAAMAQTTPTTHTRDCSEITAHAASRLTYLQNKLQITSAEQSAWNAFAAAVTTGAQSVAAACAALPTPAPTDAPSRLADRLSIASARVQAGQSELPALQALYAALSSQQQATFDTLAEHHHGWRH